MNLEYYEKKPLSRLLLMAIIVVLVLVSASFAYEINLNPSTCSSVIVNGDPEDKINIVFLSDNYRGVVKFISDVGDYVDLSGVKNGLLSVEPFTSYRKDFNFYYITEIEDLGCSTDDGYILCDDNKVKRVAASCPHDYIIILRDYNGFEAFKHLRSSAYLDVAAINTADNRLVLAHEFAHIFAGLADEYVTDTFVSLGQTPNCDIEDCPKWYGQYDDVGCFSGCTNAEFYRSTENSIMKDYSKSSEFGALNKNLLVRELL
ncbi:MAG: M64 family metallopeptidase [Candidatus Aenigmatarchaeota archaeon]